MATNLENLRKLNPNLAIEKVQEKGDLNHRPSNDLGTPDAAASECDGEDSENRKIV